MSAHRPRSVFLAERIGAPLQVILVYAVAVLAVIMLPESHGFGGNAAAMFGSVLLFSIAVGVAAMAIIETVKRLTQVRGHYQLAQVRRRLQQPAFDELVRAIGAPSRSDLLRIFNLPIEQLCAQIANALDLALAAPRRHRYLLVSLAGARYDQDHDASEEQGLELDHAVRSALNVLQISVGQRWRWQVRITAYWTSGLLGLLVVMSGNITPVARKEFALAALAVSGFFAWLARDVAALLERLRR